MFKWFRRAAMPALACLALSGCFLQPGKFDSTLDLRKDLGVSPNQASASSPLVAGQRP